MFFSLSSKLDVSFLAVITHHRRIIKGGSHLYVAAAKRKVTVVFRGQMTARILQREDMCSNRRIFDILLTQIHARELWHAFFFLFTETC